MYRTAQLRRMKTRGHPLGDVVSRPLLPSTASEAWATSIGQTGTRIAGYAFRSLRVLAQVSLRETERRIGWEKRCTREVGMAALGKAVWKRECVVAEVAGRQWRWTAPVTSRDPRLTQQLFAPLPHLPAPYALAKVLLTFLSSCPASNPYQRLCVGSVSPIHLLPLP